MNLPTTWPAPAKLNLFLHVTGRRNDGYHLLQTLFQFIDLCDELSFVPRRDGYIGRSAGNASVAEDDDLVVRAARLLASHGKVRHGVDIRLHKRIPMGAGLGGGSSDAATTLVALNHLWSLQLPRRELSQLGLTLGADVPIFIDGRASWAEGVGERLHPVELPEPWYLVITPPVVVSTATVFASRTLRRDHPPVSLHDHLAARTGNDCEPVTCALHPEVAQALDWLRQRCAHAAMSGTGASVFAAVERRENAVALAQEAAKTAGWQINVTKGLNQSPLIDIMRAR